MELNFRVAGDSTVGKSAITQSFVSDGTQFAKAYNMVGCCGFVLSGQ